MSSALLAFEVLPEADPRDMVDLMVRLIGRAEQWSS